LIIFFSFLLCHLNNEVYNYLSLVRPEWFNKALLLGVFNIPSLPLRVSRLQGVKVLPRCFVSPDRFPKDARKTVEYRSQIFFVKLQFACQSLW